MLCSSKEQFNIKTNLCESRTVRSVKSWRFRANRAQNLARFHNLKTFYRLEKSMSSLF